MKKGLFSLLTFAAFFLLLSLFLVFGEGKAEEKPKYPTRPITIVCPWKVGGAAEIGARIFAKHLSEELGVRVDVISKTGGTGATGTVFVKNADPDGHTLLQSFIGPFAQVPLYLGEESQYDPLKDFYPLGQYSLEPVVFLAKRDGPWNTIKDFIEDARKNPGKYKCGAGGALSLHALFAGQLFDMAGVDVDVVPYPGCLMGIPDLLGGDLDIIAGNPTGVALYPDLKGIAMLMGEEWPSLPDVPTLKELGYDLSTVPTWAGYSVRADTPDYIKETLVDAARKVINSEAYQKEMKEKIKVSVFYKESDDFYQLWKDSFDAMRPAIEWLKEKER